MINLSPDQEGQLLKAARDVHESMRDAFFKHAADILRPVREISDRDVARSHQDGVSAHQRPREGRCMKALPRTRRALVNRQRHLLGLLTSPALKADARTGDREAIEALSTAREELERVQRALTALAYGVAA
jgi:hypothetical protein